MSTGQDHGSFFHGVPYYFRTAEALQKAIELDRACGNDEAWFEDELALAGIEWSHEPLLEGQRKDTK